MTPKNWLMIGAAIGALGSIAPAASAQTLPGQTPTPQPRPQSGEESDLEDVVVTARRRNERAVDVPGNVSVIDAEAVRERGGATTTGELLAGQAGVRFLETTSGATSEISIRGSSTARATSSEGAVGIYRNGAYIGGGLGGRNFQRFDFFDIGRVEILRGTQGALFGRNAVGGVVNMVSAQPAFENSGWANLRYTVENQNTTAQAVANVALNDTWAMRVGAEVVDQQDGFFYNPQNDVHFDAWEGAGVRAQIRGRSGRTDVNLLVEHQDYNIPGISYQIAIAPQLAFPFGYVQPQYEYPWNRRPYGRQNVTSAILNWKQDFGWAELNSTTMTRTRQTAYQFDTDGLNPALLLQLRAAGITPFTTDADVSTTVGDKSKIFVHDSRLSGESLEGRINWLAGIEFYKLDNTGTRFTTRTPTLANTSPGESFPTAINVESWAAYGSAEIKLTDRLMISGEGRYTTDDRTFTARRFRRDTLVPVGGAGFVVDGATSPDNFSYNIITSYRVLERTLIYAKHGTSFRAGNFNSNLGDPRQPIPIPAGYDDEISTTTEFGIRSATSGGIGFNFAAYRTVTEDQIVQRDNGCAATNPACPVSQTVFLTNAGEGETTGVELEGFGRGSLGATSIRWRTSLSWQNGEVIEGPFNGETLPQVPEWLVGVDLNARHGLDNGSTLFGSVSYSAQWGGVQELYAPSTPATSRFALDDYSLVNLRAGVDFGRYQLSVFANNAFDEEIQLLITTTGIRWNQPRTTGIELRANF